MDKKLQYQAPEVDLIHLATEGAILDGSANMNGTGADVTFYDSGSFDSIFGS